MQTINPMVRFFLNLSKTHSVLANRFDRGLGGLGFSEFLILFSLDQAKDGKMRRVDLAEKIGMTASGVTRLLLPMEKVHLIESGPTESDARARLVEATPAGKEKLKEALERLEVLAEDFIPSNKAKDVVKASELLLEIGGRAVML